jgi:hypothetical protein
MNRNIYSVVCIITLLFTLYIIIQVKADSIDKNNNNNQLPPSQEPPPRIGNTPENTSSDQIATENIKTLLYPIILIFSILYTIVSYIWTVILYILSPVFWILRVLYNIFILTPYTIVQKINAYFYPLYMFLTTAALLGVLIGGMAGWFSEVITKVLVTPANELGQENDKTKAEKVKRRAQALANIRARNGGRIPEEFYDKYVNHVRNKQGTTPQRETMEGYESNPNYNNMDYRNYAGTGIGVR